MQHSVQFTAVINNSMVYITLIYYICLRSLRHIYVFVFTNVSFFVHCIYCQRWTLVLCELNRNVPVNLFSKRHNFTAKQRGITFGCMIHSSQAILATHWEVKNFVWHKKHIYMWFEVFAKNTQIWTRPMPEYIYMYFAKNLHGISLLSPDIRHQYCSLPHIALVYQQVPPALFRSPFQ